MQSCVDTGTYRLYEPGQVGGPRIVGLVSRVVGERMVRNQTAETGVDCDGATLCYMKKERNPPVAAKPRPVTMTPSDSDPSNVAFSQPEMMAIAGTNFKHGRSRTKSMSEYQREKRQQRILEESIERNGYAIKVGPEDIVERATNKLAAWAQIKVLQDRVRVVATL